MVKNSDGDWCDEKFTKTKQGVGVCARVEVYATEQRMARDHR